MINDNINYYNSDYFTPIPLDDFDNINFQTKSNTIKLENDEILTIDCETPEIGTKYENILQNNNEIKINEQKDYYNNKNKVIYFYPFFTMDKDNPNKKCKYNISYYGDNIYDIFIYKRSEEEKIKLQINNKNIIKMIYNIDNDKINLFFFLKTPPKVYIKENKIKNKKTNFFFENFKKYLSNYNYDNLYRNIDPNNLKKYYKVNHSQIKILDRSDIIRIYSKDYQREMSYFSMDNEYSNLYLNDLVIKISFIASNENKELLRILKECLKLIKVKIKNNKMTYETIKTLNPKGKIIFKKFLNENSKYFYENLKKLIPNLQFAIMSLLTIQQINIFSFDLNILVYLSNKKLEEQEKAVKVIEEMNINKNFTHINLDYETFIKEYLSYDEKIDYKYNNENTKSILITPSKIIYNITSNSTTNHFQRKLMKFNDNIIKIKIIDEDKGDFVDISSSPNLSKFIKTIFKNGITLGFIEYHYIGSSCSQLKSLGGWMVNLEGIRTLKIKKDNIDIINIINNMFSDINLNNKKGKEENSYQKYIDCDNIINLFGDFSKELNVFKNTSRKGMIFSETKYITDININNVIPLDDDKNGEYILTDGIGKISQDLIELSAEKWGINDLKIKPISAIQIRLMGSKGVLAIDPKIEKGIVVLRKSQIKFNSDDTSLNVCSVSNYKEASLNRQFIILLNSLGVKDEIFEKIQNDIIKKYCDLFIDPIKSLSNDKSLYFEFKSILYKFIPTFEDFFKKNINLINEPLFSQFIYLFVYSRLINMKYDGKLNDKRCVCLMGVIDETNTLEEDEVYVHLVHTTEYSRMNKILNQKITVYRSPSLYPGDIKILTAVKNLSLSHMKNVIVFSKKGKRPAFNKLSGGDLDGDRYFISFNDYITNNIIDTTCEPLEDPKYENQSDKHNKKEKITLDDSINCIIKATENNLVGLICDNHMAFADKEKLKAKDPKCIKLCKYFNLDIDATKTGNFIGMSELKKNNLITYKRPDFLSNGIMNKKKIYTSPGILGKLYRNIDRKMLFEKFRINFFDMAIRRKYEININFITPNCFIYLSDTYLIYEDYKKRLCNLMKKYNFCTESELFLNLRIFKNNRAYRGKGDSYNLELKDLIKYIHDEIIKKFQTINKDIASAIYIASYINIKSVYEGKVNFSNNFDENIAKLIDLFEKEKIVFQGLFKKYEVYANLKHNNQKENKNKYKRIFSLPWIIKEVRDSLLKD